MTASLTLPGTTDAIFDELRLDAATAAATVAREALAAYRRATVAYYQHRDQLGTIVPAADPGDGVKWKASTPEGARVLAAWQRARAELRAAVDVRRAEMERRR